LITWLHRILHNLAVSQVRRSREMATEDVEDAAETRWRDGSYTVDATVVVERAEAREEPQDALARLPVIYRSAVILRDVEEMIVAAIAEVQRLRRGPDDAGHRAGTRPGTAGGAVWRPAALRGCPRPDLGLPL
jgi:DNA-directed RNA polymerase specialized sigma24 family protein